MPKSIRVQTQRLGTLLESALGARNILLARRGRAVGLYG